MGCEHSDMPGRSNKLNSPYSSSLLIGNMGKDAPLKHSHDVLVFMSVYIRMTPKTMLFSKLQPTNKIGFLPQIPIIPTYNNYSLFM